jgi:hypothetical protein
MQSTQAVTYVTNAAGVRLAAMRVDGAEPTLVWLGGFRSDMGGTKAQYLRDWCVARGQSFLAFDYSGHGASEGNFADCDIGVWRDDALAVIDAESTGDLVLVGSSMGGWVALLVAMARASRVKAMTLIAPAPDFTERLLWPSLSDDARATIQRDGVWNRPSAYGDGPYPITRRLIEASRAHLILDRPIPFEGPVRILHGLADPDVPWSLSLDVAAALTSEDIRVSFVKNGDHRLSTPRDLAHLTATIEQLLR